VSDAKRREDRRWGKPAPLSVAATMPRAKREELRRWRLEQIAEQIANGSLAVRQMTDEERVKYGAHSNEEHRAR